MAPARIVKLVVTAGAVLAVTVGSLSAHADERKRPAPVVKAPASPSLTWTPCEGGSSAPPPKCRSIAGG